MFGVQTFAAAFRGIVCQLSLALLLGLIAIAAIAWMSRTLAAPMRRLLGGGIVRIALVAAMVGTGIVESFSKHTNDPPRSVALPLPSVMPEDISNGWRVAEMREGRDLSRPLDGSCLIHEPWLVRGGFGDVVRISANGWFFPWRDGFADELSVFSDGEIRPNLRTSFFPRPFDVPLAVVPAFNWHLLPGCASKDCGACKQKEVCERDIRQTLERLPNLLNCTQQWDAGLIVTSNIFENVRKLDDPCERRFYVSSYTSAILSLDFPIDVALDDKVASRRVAINLSSYYELVECGFSMLCELDSMNPDAWDFLLESPRKYKKALSMRITRLEAAGVSAVRFRTDALYNELRDGVQNCSCIIGKGWYPSAKRRMSSSQLKMIREKIKIALGDLPPEIEKDELGGSQ